MQTVQKLAERLTGHDASGFQQTDVADLRGRVREHPRLCMDFGNLVVYRLLL